MTWLYKHDSTLKLPYQDHLSALIHEPRFRRAVGPAIFAKIKVVKDIGNLAVHRHKSVRPVDGVTAILMICCAKNWIPQIPGISSAGSYEDYGRNPGNWIYGQKT